MLQQVRAAVRCWRSDGLTTLVAPCSLRGLCARQRKGWSSRIRRRKKPRRVALPDSAVESLEAHRKEQNKFRQQFGTDYRADLDLIFANPDGTPLRPDSISSSVSALFSRLKIPKPKGAA